MDILLINSNSRLVSASLEYRKFLTPIAPMGLCYIAAVLREKGINVSLVDQLQVSPMRLN